MANIDDIDYLRLHSEKENSIIYVDSSHRDYYQFRKPNSYTINFDEPFKNVYGIEILDIAVPRTMYQIDQYNDTLFFYTKNEGEESITLDHGDYEIEEIIQFLNEKMHNNNNSDQLKAITAYELTIPASRTNKIFFSNNNTEIEDNDFFYILAFKSNLAETLGFDEPSDYLGSPTDYTLFTENDNEYINIATSSNLETYTSQQIIRGTFKSGIGKGEHSKDAYQISSSFANTQNIQTPGVVNLTADRYVRLRSDTIEQHLQTTSSGVKNSVGIGLFKLGVIGYADTRTDYTSVNIKDFHPIGKLGQIDFRFELLNGELYDFKGVNHHFLLNIKYLIPENKRELIKPDYVLNPNYNPNMIEYKKTQYSKEDESDDSDIVEEMTQNFSKNYLEPEKKYIRNDFNYSLLNSKKENSSDDNDNGYNTDSSNNIDSEDTDSSSDESFNVDDNENNILSHYWETEKDKRDKYMKELWESRKYSGNFNKNPSIITPYHRDYKK
jgi:hypothetical protein